VWRSSDRHDQIMQQPMLPPELICMIHFPHGQPPRS